MAEVSINQRELKKGGAINGLIFGIIVLLAGIISVYMLANTANFALVVATPLIVSLLVPLGAAVFLALSLRKRVGGYWTLRQATTGIFIMFIVAYTFSTVGNFVFYEVSGPALKAKTKENLVRVTTSFLERQGANQDEIDASVDKVNAGFAEGAVLTTGQMVQGYLQAIIIIFVVALIFAAIFKKEPPVFVREED
ncbi:DUF4199 domain-containing protein [Arcticibacter sp.]|uniref:DUF4199 domain-containing protein n=1 Tax=Arcticibacter sp. TaxID=1872630 RepID=UPI00388F6E15